MSKTTPFDFWYAVNNTEVVLKPRRHLETFGHTVLNYAIVSELMDTIGKVRVREGRMHAARPQIITPSAYSEMILEGFGEQAEKYADWLRENESNIHILRYGYTLRKESFNEEVFSDNIDAVLERVKKDFTERKDPFSAVVKGVENPWDVCLIKLFWQVIQESVSSNFSEMARQKMFEVRDGIPMGVRREIDEAFSAAARDPSLIKKLGSRLQELNLFNQYQDRFFALVNAKRS